MRNERRFLLLNEKLGLEHYYISIICVFVFLFSQLVPRTFDIYNKSGFIAFLLLELFVSATLIIGITNDLWALEPIRFCEEGIEYRTIFHQKKLLPWETISHVYTTTLMKSNTDHPKIICCSLTEKRNDIQGAWHGMVYYRLHQKEYFVMKYSDCRLERIIRQRNELHNDSNVSEDGSDWHHQ